MRILIIYASKRGFTQGCIKMLQDKLGPGTETLELKKNTTPPDWDGFGKVIIGGPVYMGKTLKILEEFIQRWKTELGKKPLGLFLTSLSSKESAITYMESIFPEELTEKAMAKGFFGGAIRRSALPWFERLLLNFMGIKQDVSNLNILEITSMAQKVKDWT